MVSSNLEVNHALHSKGDELKLKCARLTLDFNPLTIS